MLGRSANCTWWLLFGMLAAAGCGGPPAPPQPPERIAPERGLQSVEINGSVIRMAGAEGKWTFEATSERATAAGMKGPYVLAHMEGRYEHTERHPVLMRADRAELDEQAKRVKLVGSVWVRFGASQLEAEQVEYDLETGEVAAVGRTKWSFGEARGKAVDSEQNAEASR